MIVIGGENLIDFIQEPTSDGYPVYRAVPGGSPYNTAKAVARQGQNSGYLTPFSTDTLGQLLRSAISGDPVSLLAPASDRPTSLAVVSLQEGQAQYQFYRENTAERDITLESLLASMPKEARAFYIGSLALAHGPDAESWAQFYLKMKQKGLFCALDPNIRAAFIHDKAEYLTRLNGLMGHTDLIKLSDEDLAWIAPGKDMRDAARDIFAASSAGLVVLTMGAEGAFAISNAGEVEIPAHPVDKMIDTVGAGDTFMGTLLAQSASRDLMADGALKNAPLSEINAMLETAAKAAALNCARKGCNPPTVAELNA